MISFPHPVLGHSSTTLSQVACITITQQTWQNTAGPHNPGFLIQQTILSISLQDPVPTLFFPFLLQPSSFPFESFALISWKALCLESSPSRILHCLSLLAIKLSTQMSPLSQCIFFFVHNLFLFHSLFFITQHAEWQIRKPDYPGQNPRSPTSSLFDSASYINFWDFTFIFKTV